MEALMSTLKSFWPNLNMYKLKKTVNRRKSASRKQIGNMLFGTESYRFRAVHHKTRTFKVLIVL